MGQQTSPRIRILLACFVAGSFLIWAASAPIAAPPATRPAESRPSGPGDEDYRARAATLRRELGPGFIVLIEKPFVVAGDGGSAAVRSSAEHTVRWAVKLLKQDYFERNPDELITIYLFKDAESYVAHNKKLFGGEPTTPYGYYSNANHALVMNIATGGGTLVHEIVHPFVRANFPECPSWFNEGLGSLYEQSEEKDGHIHGRTNWRLAGLQRAIHDDEAPSFRELTATDDDEFYGENRGVNYAAARYLCYYLQEHELLVKYYHAFVKAHEDDPTGYKTLVEVLGEKDMSDFEKRWRKWVLALRFP